MAGIWDYNLELNEPVNKDFYIDFYMCYFTGQLPEIVAGFLHKSVGTPLLS